MIYDKKGKMEFSDFDNMVISQDHCFLCGAKLNDENRTKEHIYPKWFQTKFNLWNEHLILLNSTRIPYRNLTIPCCNACNSEMSKYIEEPMKKAFEKGYESFIEADRDVIFSWLNKIAFGILFKETTLKKELSTQNSDTIFSEDKIYERKIQHIFLKSSVGKVKYQFEKPYSLLIFKINNLDNRYWSTESPELKTFYMMASNIGVICHLMDNGYNEGFFCQHDEMKQLLSEELSPVQFIELCAKFQYKVSLFYRTPYYQLYKKIDDDEIGVISNNIYGDAYSEWDNRIYASFLQHYLEIYGINCDYDELLVGDNVLTTLFKEDGSFNKNHCCN